MTSPASGDGGTRPRAFRPWTGVVILVIGAAAAVFLLVDAAMRAGVGQMLLLAPWVLLAVWAVYAVSASVLRVDARGVLVQNLLRRTSFGWAHVTDIDFRWQIEFQLDDGSTVSSMGGPARARPRRRTEREREVEGARPPSGVRELSDLQDRWRSAAADATAPIRRSWDYPALVVFVVLAAWAVSAIVIAR